MFIMTWDVQLNSYSLRFSGRIGAVEEDSCSGCSSQNKEVGTAIDDWFEIARDCGRPGT